MFQRRASQQPEIRRNYQPERAGRCTSADSHEARRLFRCNSDCMVIAIRCNSDCMVIAIGPARRESMGGGGGIYATRDYLYLPLPVAIYNPQRQQQLLLLHPTHYLLRPTTYHYLLRPTHNYLLPYHGRTLPVLRLLLFLPTIIIYNIIFDQRFFPSTSVAAVCATIARQRGMSLLRIFLFFLTRCPNPFNLIYACMGILHDQGRKASSNAHSFVFAHVLPQSVYDV